ncbi:BRO family protein [Enterococcus ratti]|uniref:BRO family protein n=1 Tax=Enterococcus ratti TaxID=150033 RepID=A0A1L8W8H7_9ENTE|nr:BRO family protein [Enterococcus ratti]OJG77350.1 BRO family protein [Enterococcus ratti]
MEGLVLAQEELFQGISCDLWVDNKGNPYMTIQQLANALEYKSKSGIENIISRNPYLRSKEFSGTHRLAVPKSKGGTQETIVFTRDGIMEISFLSPKPKAREFRAWARKVLNGFIDGQLVWKERRKISKESHRDLNTIIAKHFPAEKVQIRCINFSQLLCELVTGYKSVGSYKKSLGVSDGRALAELLDEQQLKKYNDYLNRIAVFLDSGFTFKDIATILKGDSINIKIETKKKEIAR